MFEPIRHHLYAINTNRYDTTLLRAVYTQDRYEPAAVQWLRAWKPEELASVGTGTRLPACACHTGRCAVCN